MSFNSVNFLVFFPIVAILYYVIPENKKFNLKNVWLLIASYYFYMSWNPRYVVLILISTITTFFCGILMDRVNNNNLSDNKKRRNKITILIASLAVNLGILFIFKYGDFALQNINAVLGKLNIIWNKPKVDLLLPVGISFYTFQAIGYTIDVYRDEIPAEKNFIQYALFVSFFPQLVAGPIERSGNLLAQLDKKHSFDLLVIREGLLTMLWGFFMKLVIADRACLYVDYVYNDYGNYTGWYLIVATILFGIQIYCDFNGYTMIARGAAKVMGFNLMENFDAPYLSTTVSEFWRKWHISLTSWFRDYLYIPLGGNRKGTIRKYINILIVFSLSGLWHGANWTYVIWGMLNGIYQVVGKVLTPIRTRITGCLRLNVDSLGHRLAKTAITFCLVDFSWMFFRAGTLKDSVGIAKNMIKTNNIWILFDHESIFKCGLDRYDFGILLFAVFILLVADICKVNRIGIMKDILLKQDLWFRWMIYIVTFLFVLIFGIWGSGYTNTAFLYFQF